MLCGSPVLSFSAQMVKPNYLLLFNLTEQQDGLQSHSPLGEVLDTTHHRGPESTSYHIFSMPWHSDISARKPNCDALSALQRSANFPSPLACACFLHGRSLPAA